MRMIENTYKTILKEYKDTKDIILVSGCAAWADHIAIKLFLTNRFKKLHLYLPCKLDLNLIKTNTENKTLQTKSIIILCFLKRWVMIHLTN